MDVSKTISTLNAIMGNTLEADMAGDLKESNFIYRHDAEGEWYQSTDIGTMHRSHDPFTHQIHAKWVRHTRREQWGNMATDMKG